MKKAKGALGSVIYVNPIPVRHLKANEADIVNRAGSLSTRKPMIGTANIPSMTETTMILWYTIFDSSSDCSRPESTNLVIQSSI